MTVMVVEKVTEKVEIVGVALVYGVGKDGVEEGKKGSIIFGYRG